MIFLPESDFLRASKIGNRIITNFNNEILIISDDKIKINLSIGISEYNNDQTYDELINSAD